MEQVNVSSLSRTLGVSEATIRTDLEGLEKEGFLTRFHGGATINKKEESDLGMIPTEAETGYSQSKADIGSVAAAIIQNKDGIFLGPGTTTYQIALALKKRTDIYVNIVTNNFYVAQALKGCPNYNIHFLSGKVRSLENNFYTAPENLQLELNNLFMDKFFFSVDAVDIEEGYSLSDPVVHDTIIMAAEHSKEVIVAADFTKFNKRSFMKVGDLSFANTVITNDEIEDNYRRHFDKLGVRVLTRKNLITNAAE